MRSDSELNEIRNRVSIVDVISHYTRVVKEGAGFKAVCIFHADKNPSMSIDPEKRVFHCFGCSAAGNVFQFVERAEKVSFDEAVKKLEGDRPYLDESKKVSSTFQRFSNAVEWPIDKWMPCHKAAMESQELAKEFAARGIKFETIYRHHIGFIPTGEKLVSQNDERLASFRKKPWIGFAYVYGQTVRMIKWRPFFSVGKEFMRIKGMAEVLYVDNPEPDSLEEILLVEGEMDALTLWQCGYRAASLPSGSQSKITGEMSDYLGGFRNIYLCVDNDDAGKLCLRRLLKILPADKTRIVTVPAEHKDVNGMFVKGCGADDGAFRLVMDKLLSEAEKPSSVAFESLDKAFEAYIRFLGDEGNKEKFFELPWRAADNMVVFAPGQTATLASTRSKQGKTSFMIQTAMHNALYRARRIGYYTAEMDLVKEMIPMITAQIMRQDRNHLEVDDVEQARNRCVGAEFYFGYDPAAQTWEDVAALIDMAVRRLGLDVVIIDHLDYIIREPDFRKEMSAKSMAMKYFSEQLAKKYGILVWILRQFNKPHQTSGKKRDEPGDIYSVPGSISGITDVHHAFILWRKMVASLEESGSGDAYENESKLILGLTRAKGTGGRVCNLQFNGKFARFDRPNSSDEKGPDGKVVEMPAPQTNLPYRDAPD
jgi:hypothetical protein